MSRHIHHQHRHHPAVLSRVDDLPKLDNSPHLPLRQHVESLLSHSKDLLKRTPPGVSGSSSGGSSSDSSSDSTSSSGSSSGGGSGGSSGSSDSSSSGGFGVGDGWGEKKPAPAHHGVNISIPVALGVVIPILLAVILFFFLHRRHVKKLRQEDANDPHKSLDFGWDPKASVSTKKKRGIGKKGKPEMTDNNSALEKSLRNDRGLSMDMNLGSPYIMPAGVHGSRESLNSMSRTIQSHDDRYRTAASHYPNETASLRSHTTKPVRDDASSYHRSPSANRKLHDDNKQDLASNTQRLSHSTPLKPQQPIPEIQEPAMTKDVARKPLPSQPAPVTNSGLAPTIPSSDARDSYQPNEHVRKSNNYLGAFIHSRDPSMEVRTPESGKSEYVTPRESPLPPTAAFPLTDEHTAQSSTLGVPENQTRPARQQSLRSSQHASIEQTMYDESSEYGDAVKVTPASPASSQEYHTNNRGSSQEYMPPIDEHSYHLDEGDLGYDVNRLSMGVRPLPPDDPTDNPEQRANRIRSFYKEYFDDSRPDPSGAAYYEDYDESYLGDGAIFDPVSGQYMTAPPRHYAEPYGRRAMTPPPRVGRHHGHGMSAGSHLAPPRARAFSTASGGRGPRRPPPKKRLPPPSPLRALPTPHMLKEDAFALPIDFAPAATARDRRAGIPDSPRGGARPYSPAVRAHTPLARSYDDLAVMPSPHLLRKSGTFTALDFAPPPRFKNSDSGSDAGSIRSNRSGMSSRTQHAVRAGAYRVSRIPKEMVGSKVDLQQALKPSWNLHNNTTTTGLTL